MTDIHSHILFGVDDGSRTIEESLEILRSMEKCGYKNIILTPHYIKDSNYNSSATENFKKLKILRDACFQNNIKINLYLGNEIYIDDDILGLLKNKEIYSLNGTPYLLVELPMSGEYNGYEEVFRELISHGCQVILAHPERYTSFQNDYEKIHELENMGVYFQGNIDSLVGKYGERANTMLRRLLKERKIAFLATDIHHPKHDYSNWIKAKTEALKYITEEEYEILVDKNPSQLIG